MKAMLSFVTVLLCIIAARAAVLPMTGFDLDGVKGKWYVIGFATNAGWFVRQKSTMKMGTAMLMPTADGDLEISCSNLKNDGSCWRMKHLAKKTDIPGRYVYHSERWGNNNDMLVVDAKSDEFALIYTIQTKGQSTNVLSIMYGRTTALSADLKKKFEKFSLESGILPENIAILAPNGEC